MDEERIPRDVQIAMAPFIAALEALQIRYYVGGSVAAMVWSRPRLTQDADLVVDLVLDQIPAFVVRIEADYYVDPEAVQEAIQRRAAFNAIHLPTGLKPDSGSARCGLMSKTSARKTARASTRASACPAYSVVPSVSTPFFTAPVPQRR